MNVDSVYRLVYDYFDNVDISVDSQMQRIRDYDKKGEKAKSAIASLVLARICRQWGSFYDFYLYTYRKDRFKGVEAGIEAEVKRGFFTKDVVFNGKELEVAQ